MKNLYNAIFIFSLPIILLAQTERWIYRYNGPGNGWDQANSIVFGLDENIYAAGLSKGIDTNLDLIVTSITTDGETNWFYRYNGPGNGWDEALSLAYGLDGNIYAAGKCNLSAFRTQFTVNIKDDFIVINLDSTGAENWIFRYGAITARNRGYSIVYGNDNNIYVAGTHRIVSLTPEGEKNWVYTYSGSDAPIVRANAIVYGLDGNIYVAGKNKMISLTADGDTNWVYTFKMPGADLANSITYGADGNIYAAGISIGKGTDFTVVSLDTTGKLNWSYTYNGQGNNLDRANAIVYGLDGNIYVAGTSNKGGTHSDFTVISLTTKGKANWVYTYKGPGTDIANSIVYGEDGNIYAAGTSDKNGIIISLTTDGDENWVYEYDGPGKGLDEIYSIVYGADGNIYAAGTSQGKDTDRDFIVISLEANTEEGSD
jgi:hypothetical protein